MSNESFTTIVIGGGQAGLAAGHHLAKHRDNFIILDKEQRAGHLCSQIAGHRVPCNDDTS